MAAISIVKFDSGNSEVLRGSLMDCPAEFFTIGQMSFYQSCKAGWSRCPLGYATYAAFDSMGRKLVVPGIITPDDQAPNRKFPNHPLRFSKEKIESFLAPHIGVSEEVRSQRDKEFKNLTHDLRAISTEIYHTALSARREAELRGQPDIVIAVDTVMAAQQMMSLRLDIVDYESGHSAGRPKEQIPVFKKVDKVVRCFANKLSHRRIVVKADGRSFGTTFGPPIFEIVPFVIVENAVKYAPSGSELTVRFEENDDEIIVRFESYGPKIKEGERDRLFDQHFRGEAAKKSEKSGSGIGLFAARTILESQFDGKIFVNQLDQTIWCDGDVSYLTRFTIILPRQKDLDDSFGYRKRRIRVGVGSL
jgi:hypothetical protein